MNVLVMPKPKKAALLLTAGGRGFASAIQTYSDAIINHMGARYLGIVTAAGSQARSSGKLNEARSIAKKLQTETVNVMFTVFL